MTLIKRNSQVSKQASARPVTAGTVLHKLLSLAALHVASRLREGRLSDEDGKARDGLPPKPKRLSGGNPYCPNEY